MPIYEYQCSACGHQLEAMQKFSDEPLKQCPTCGQDTLNKLISATSFQLKGTGWYVTDFRDNKPKDKSENAKAQVSQTTDTQAKAPEKSKTGKSAESGNNTTA